MPHPPTPAAAAVTSAVDARTPRVVFFGPPSSGKSALLHAFVRAASDGSETAVQPPAAGPENSIRRELVPHVIRVENPAAGGGGPVVVCDCDGRAAGELLAHQSGLVRGLARGALAQAVRSADALVLVVDAAAPPEVVDQTFSNFGKFLDGLEEGRTFGREVGGLPVFLTLAKCDALYVKGDAPTDWLARVEEREREVKARFEDYFGEDTQQPEPSPFLPFGSLDLHLAATSIQVPPGTAFEAYADPDGTFGVAALVADVLPAARAYRNRVLSARTRLRWTLTGSGLLLGAMLLGLVVLAASGGFGGGGDTLLDRVRNYKRDEPSPAVRLSDRNFAHFRGELVAFRDDPRFERLPADLRSFVEDRLREFDTYREYRDKFKPPRLGPAEVQTAAQAAQLEADLKTTLAPPPEYAQAWADTEAVRLWKKWQTDLELVREAEARLHDWYRGLIRRGNQLLLTETPPDYGWRGRVTALLKEAETPPFPPEQPIEKSPEVPVLRGRKLTYASAFESERVTQAQLDWQATDIRLRQLRDLTDAIGLTSGPGTPRPVLELPEPTPDATGSKELAAARLAALRAAFPPPAYPDDRYPEWTANNFPDPVRRAIEARLGSILDTGARHVRRLVAAAAPDPETAEGWRRVADGLLQEEGLKAWDRLLRLLRSWADAPQADPVQELAEFLRRDRFDLTLKSVQITVADDLLDQRPIPSGRFVVTHTPAGGSPTEYPFRLQGEGKRQRPVTVYTFVPDGHSGTITYRPGDGLTAALPLRAGGEYRLVWSSGRSAVYQTDRLAQAPRLEKVGPVPAPEPAPGAGLTVSPPGGLPVPPALFPDLRPR